MKINKNYKLIFLIVLCLIIILLLIYLKDKKIDLFSISINPYEIQKYLQAQEFDNNLQNQLVEQDVKIDKLTKDTQIVINGGIMYVPTTKPIIPFLLQSADQEDITTELKSNNPVIPNSSTTNSSTPNSSTMNSSTTNSSTTNSPTPIPDTQYPMFVVPIPQPAFVPITNEAARTACEQSFNDINKISQQCKTYSNTINSFNNNLNLCVSDLYEAGANNLSYINESIQTVNTLCTERQLLEAQNRNLSNYYFI